MLVLGRFQDESIMIGDEVEVMVVKVQGNKVRLGIRAPQNLGVHRKEVHQMIQQEAAKHREASARNAGGTDASHDGITDDRCATDGVSLPQVAALARFVIDTNDPSTDVYSTALSVLEACK